MIRTRFVVGVLALMTVGVVHAATLVGLSWASVSGRPALRLVLQGHRQAQLSAHHHGRLLRIHLANIKLGRKVVDLPALGTIKGAYPYLADHGHGINIDVLLAKKAHMHLITTASGYLVVLTGVPVTIAAPHAAAMIVPKVAKRASNVLTHMGFFTLPGDRVELHLVTTQPPTKPSAFVVTNPAMIVLDLPNTRLGLAQDTLHVGQGAVDKVTAVESHNTTRVVIGLIHNAGYMAYIHPHAVDVIVQNPTARISQAVVTPTAPPVLPTTQYRGRYSIRAITFHRGRQGAGKIGVRLSSSNVTVTVHNQDQQIVVDFHDTYVPTALQRRLIVTDFATPIDTIKTFVRGRTTRMVISASGHYTQVGYQAQRNFVLRVTPVSRSAYKALEQRKNRYAGRKITLNFQKISVRAALQVLANFTGLNFVTSNAVKGNLTLELHDVPWRQALKLILTTKNLAMRQRGNIILVEPAAIMAAQRQAHLKAEMAAQKLEPLETVLIRINYAKASDIASVLKSTRTVGAPTQTTPFSSVNYSKATTESTSLLSARGQVTVDPRTNSLIIQDTPQRIKAIRKLISKLDRPVRQVLIEARLVEANDGFNKSLGAQLGLNYSYSTPSTQVSTCAAATCTGAAEAASSPAGGPGAGGVGAFNVNLPSAGIGSSLPATFALTVAKLANNNLLNLELSALQAENKGKIISSPRLITANDRKADIKQGQEQFFNLGFGQSTLQQAVLGLSVTPQITPDNRIIMTVKITDNSFADAVSGTLDEKSIKTQVLVNNGQTVVIGGIYQNSRLRTVTKVPFLGDLPLIGELFRNTNVDNSRTELLIFLTPRILAPSLSLQSG